MLKLFNYLRKSCMNDIHPGENIIYSGDGSSLVLPDKNFYFKVYLNYENEYDVTWGTFNDFTHVFKTENGTLQELNNEISKIKHYFDQNIITCILMKEFHPFIQELIINKKKLDYIKMFILSLLIDDENDIK